jgi:hypothetical protein
MPELQLKAGLVLDTTKVGGELAKAFDQALQNALTKAGTTSTSPTKQDTGGFLESMLGGKEIATMLGKLLVTTSVIVTILKSSLLLQKTLAALAQMATFMLKPIGDVIGGIFYTFLKLVTPFFRMMMLMWRPFYQRMMQGVVESMKSGGGGIAGATGVIFKEFGSFLFVMLEKVVAEIVKLGSLFLEVGIKGILLGLGILASLLAQIPPKLDDLKNSLINVLLLIATQGRVGFSAPVASRSLQYDIEKFFANLLGAFDTQMEYTRLSLDLTAEEFFNMAAKGEESTGSLSKSMEFVNDSLIKLASSASESFGGFLDIAFTVSSKAKKLMSDFATQLDVDVRTKFKNMQTVLDNTWTEIETRTDSLKNYLIGGDSVADAVEKVKEEIEKNTIPALLGQEQATIDLDIELDKLNTSLGDAKTKTFNFDEQLKWLSDTITITLLPTITSLQYWLVSVDTAVGNLKDTLTDLWNQITSWIPPDNGSGGGATGGSLKPGEPSYNPNTGQKVKYWEDPWTPIYQDFIMRPGQSPISFSPNDTIIGTKSGLDRTPLEINISQHISPTMKKDYDVDELAEELARRTRDSLRRRMSYGV